MSDSFNQFGFNQDDDAATSTSKRFKAEAGRSYRLSFAWWPGIENGDLDLDAKTPEFVGAQRNYIPGVGYFINRGPEYTRLAGDNPRMAIGAVVIEWPMTSKGDIDKEAIAKGDIEVKPWIFSKDKYSTFKTIHKEFPFGSHDIIGECTDTTYQKMTFTPCRESILRKLKEKGGAVYSGLIAKIQAVAGSIQGDIGREMTLDQIREKMSGGGSAGGAAVAVNAASTKEIDSIVDNLLD